MAAFQEVGLEETKIYRIDKQTSLSIDKDTRYQSLKFRSRTGFCVRVSSLAINYSI